MSLDNLGLDDKSRVKTEITLGPLLRFKRRTKTSNAASRFLPTFDSPSAIFMKRTPGGCFHSDF